MNYKMNKQTEEWEGQEEFKELEKENTEIRKGLEDICFINKIEGEEAKEFWGLIGQLIDNEIKQESFCNR